MGRAPVPVAVFGVAPITAFDEPKAEILGAKIPSFVSFVAFCLIRFLKIGPNW